MLEWEQDPSLTKQLRCGDFASLVEQTGTFYPNGGGATSVTPAGLARVGAGSAAAVVDWDSTCAMSTRGWLDLARALWILKRESYHKIATKAGEYGTLAIQDAAEELGGGFVAELGSKGGASGRMRVFHGPHAPAEQHMTSGPKELCFIRNSIKEAIRLWKQKGHSTSRHGS